jgi:hypothetical protein
MPRTDPPRGHHRPLGWPRALEWLEERTLLSTILVSNPADHGPGTLRDAIDQANLSSGNTIEFEITGTITLTGGLPDLSQNVTIAGPGASVLTIQRSTAADTPLFSLFVVDEDVRATIAGLTLANGKAVYGGGISNAGRLTVSNCTFSGDSATHGGGINNSGTVTVSNCTFSGDSGTHIDGDPATTADDRAEAALAKATNAENDLMNLINHDPKSPDIIPACFTYAALAADPAIYGGGAIANFGRLTVSHSTFSDNLATDGGGILSYGTMIVSHSILSNNLATKIGGGIANLGTLAVNQSTLLNNSATYGGGIASGITGTLTVSSSTVSNNSASGLGGGGIDNFGTSIVSNTSFSGNSSISAASSGGAIVNFGTLTVGSSAFSGNAASVIGGAILNFGGTLTVNDSSFSGNSASSGDAIANASGTSTVNNSSLSGGLAVPSSAVNVSTQVVGNTPPSATLGGTAGAGATPLVAQALSSAGSVSPASSSGTLTAGTGAPPEVVASPTSPSIPSAETDVVSAAEVGSPADPGETALDPTAVSAAIVALASAPGVTDTRLGPLRESSLALVGTVLPLTLETATKDVSRNSVPLETSPGLLIGPGPVTGISRGLPGSRPGTDRGPTRGGDDTRDETRPALRGGPSWERFILGLDRDFDQFRRTFREQTSAREEPKLERAEAVSRWNPDHPRATDEVFASRWSDEIVSAPHVRFGSRNMARPVGDGPVTLEILREGPPITHAVSWGDESLGQLPDPGPAGTKPLQVSLSGVALGLALGCAWFRLRRRKREAQRVTVTG